MLVSKQKGVKSLTYCQECIFIPNVPCLNCHSTCRCWLASGRVFIKSLTYDQACIFVPDVHCFYCNPPHQMSVSKRKGSDEFVPLPYGQEAHWEVCERILFVYAKLNPGLGYIQVTEVIVSTMSCYC